MESAERPKTIAIVVHAYISGQPHSIRCLEEVYAEVVEYAGVAHLNGAELYDWYNGHTKVHP